MAEAIESVLTQTFGDFELIICDNASTDATPDIARSYAARDQRVRLVRNNVNIGAARNYGRAVELARGKYFRWAAADDRSAATFLERCVEVIERDPGIALVYPRTKLIDERGSVISEYEDNLHIQSPRPSERFRQLLQRLGLCNAVYGLMPLEILRRTRLLQPYVGSDVVFQAELILYGTFWEIPEYLFFRRLHEGASSTYNAKSSGSYDEARIHQFYNPHKRQAPYLREFRHLWEYTRIVARSRIPWREKLTIAAYVLRMAYWRRDLMRDEAVTGLRWALGKFGMRSTKNSPPGATSELIDR